MTSKYLAITTATCLVLFNAVTQASAEEMIRNVGILGNSGEQGDTLVRLNPTPATGLGIVYDPDGGIWDRAGEGRLNRYAVDGRRLGSWKLPAFHKSHLPDGIVLLKDRLLIKQGRSLCTLRVQASPNEETVSLPTEATLISTRSHDGWVAASNDREVFLVNERGEKKPIINLASAPSAIEIGPDGEIYVQMRVESGRESRIVRINKQNLLDETRTWESPGEKLQWLNNFWFGNSWHGTLRRFSQDFQPAPGVVLGGNSGAFIGYVPGNYEIARGHGLASLTEDLFAISGEYGMIHLIKWDAASQRFEITRRIGAVPSCSALALDSQGRIWHHSGIWHWDDSPDAPLLHGVPQYDVSGHFAMMVTNDDELLALSQKTTGDGFLYSGKLDNPVDRYSMNDLLPQSCAATLVQWKGKPTILCVNATGHGRLILAGRGARGDRSPAGEVNLQSTEPLKQITTLSVTGNNSLVSAVDGSIVHFRETDQGWKEHARWNQWGQDDTARFGKEIYAALSENRLWVSDFENHRVLCFDLSHENPILLGRFGSDAKSGDSFFLLNGPRAIAAQGTRAVVYDSGNQRLVRLELQDKDQDKDHH